MFFVCSFSGSGAILTTRMLQWSIQAQQCWSTDRAKKRTKKCTDWRVWLSTCCFLPEQDNKAILPKSPGSWSCMSHGELNNKVWSSISAPAANVDDKVTNALCWSSQMTKSTEDLKSQFEVRLRNKQGISTFSENGVGMCWYLYPPWCHPLNLL